MLVFTTKNSLEAYYAETGLTSETIGFVPTMGALHEGHISLIDRAVSENKFVVCSIFVNPTQFNNLEDLKNYPSTLEADVEKLRTTGCSLLFLPSVEEMYSDKEEKLHFSLGQIESVMEGSSRPGHFQGVCTIVYKLFSLIKPRKAYFGLKDFQQIAVIRKMIEQTSLAVELVPCEIVREMDGLAMSSRNARLTAVERAEAPLIFQVLNMAAKEFEISSLEKTKDEVLNAFKNHPLFKLDYFTVVDAHTLAPIKQWGESREMRACIAVTLGKIRLIDNMAIIL